MTEEELLACASVQDLYYCKNGNVYSQNYKDKCVYALYSQDTEKVKNNCHFIVLPYNPISIQLNSTTFLINHGQHVRAQLRCDGKKEESVLIEGRVKITLDEGCQLITPKAILESSLNVWSDPIKVIEKPIHLGSVLTEEELQLLKNAPSFMSGIDRKKLQFGIPTHDIIDGYKARLVSTSLSISFGLGIGLLALALLIILWRRWVHFRKRKTRKENKAERRKRETADMEMEERTGPTAAALPLIEEAPVTEERSVHSSSRPAEAAQKEQESQFCPIWSCDDLGRDSFGRFRFKIP